MYVNDAECEYVNLDPREVERIARNLSRWAKKADALGLYVFGGDSCGTLRKDDAEGRDIVVAHVDGTYAGGDGASGPWGPGGLEAGESGPGIRGRVP